MLPTDAIASNKLILVMCGRARCTLSREEVMAAARVGQDQATSWRQEEKYHASANVGPGQSVFRMCMIPCTDLCPFCLMGLLMRSAPTG